jgi:hypothetical protein
MTSPIHSFESHIEGKNARVEIHEDRIEWARDRGRSTTAALLTGGASLLTKRKTESTEILPVRSISSVSTKRDGMRNSLVIVSAPGAGLAFRVSHAEAAQAKETLTRLMLA